MDEARLGALRDRFALERFEHEGILVDLASGVYFAINDAAALAWDVIAAGGGADEAEAALCRAFDIEPARAREDVAAFVRELANAPPTAAVVIRAARVTFASAEGEGFAMLWGGCAVLSFDRGGRRVARSIEMARTAEAAGLADALVLKWAAPHLLAAQGLPVLHASAVLASEEERVTAFSGASGAGKTAMARAFGSAGSVVVAEDLLVVRREGGGVCAVLDGEAKVGDWVERSKEELASRSDVTFDASGLSEGVCGAARPLARLLLLDADDRAGDSLAVRRLGPVDALGALLANSFAELGERGVWRDALRSSAAIVRTVPVLRATAPLGLDALARAARAYSATSTS